MCTRGLHVQEIQAHLLALYGTTVSPDLTSAITDAVLEAAGQFQRPPLQQSLQ